MSTANEIEPIVFKHAKSHVTTLLCNLKTVMTPHKDSHGMLCVEYKRWNLFAYSNTMDGLRAEINDQMIMLWKNYAKEDDDNLTDGAVTIKHALLADWQEVSEWKSCYFPPPNGRVVQVAVLKQPHFGRIVVGYWSGSHWVLLYGTRWMYEPDGIFGGMVVKWKELI